MGKGSDTRGPVPAGYLTRVQAAERLGVSVRTFQKYENENPIEGMKTEGDGPKARRLYPEEVIDRLVIEDAAEEQQGAMSALLREVARASKEIHLSAQVAIESGVRALKGTDTRTKSLRRELRRMSKSNRMHEKDKLKLWELLSAVQELRNAEGIQAAKREAAIILDNARGNFMIESAKMAWPGLIHRIFPSDVTERAVMGVVFKKMVPELRAKFLSLVGELPGEVQASLGMLLQPVLEELAKQEEAEQKEQAAKAGKDKKA